RLRFYHKLRSIEDYTHWLETGEIVLAWNDTVYSIIYENGR
ncbi:unnamed protein product, partial [marine sediment metagenome]